MAKRKRGGRRSRFNFGFSAPKKVGLTAFLKPSNYVGVLPILGGVIIDGIFTKFVGDKSKYTRSGIGNIALGVIGAGLLGGLAGAANRQLGEGLFVGGMVGTAGCAFQNFMQGGFKHAFGLGDESNWYSPVGHGTFMGMGNFTSPGAIASAIPSESTMAQYSLPNTNAQFLPGAAMQPAQTPNQAHQARHMADMESSMIGSMMAGSEDISGFAQ